MTRPTDDDASDESAERFFHGTRAALQPGDLVQPCLPGEPGSTDGKTAFVLLTERLDEAIWEAELAEGEGPPRAYEVDPVGVVEVALEAMGRESVGHPAMSLCSRQALRILGETSDWPLYHGTRADLRVGDLVGLGYRPNFGNRDRSTTYVYFARTLDAAIWGAELADGDGPGRIYTVEPTGPIEDDPNVTDKKFRGNPTKSFRSRDPLRVTGEVADWKGHSPERVAQMKAGLRRLEDQGVEPED